MKRTIPVLFILISLCACTLSVAQGSTKPVYVIVHGAWGGGWQFKKIDPLLTAKGHIVYRPTLTGLGERAHLSSPEIGLSTHINDVVSLILFENLKDIILVGHSYGGMVVTGVADSIPEQIGKLIYLDAFVPEDGENLISLVVDSSRDRLKNMVIDGFVIPTWVPAGKPHPIDVPHPYKTFTDKLVLKNQDRLKISTAYIFTVEKGMDPKADDFAAQAERARKKGWPVIHMEANHNPQWFVPEALVSVLEKIE